MEHVGIPDLDEILDDAVVEPYPWHKSLKEIAHEPFVVLHTSGSTGQPKMVEVNHGLVATIDAQQDLPNVDGRCITARLWKDTTLYGAMPLFHSAGFNVLAFSIFQGTQVILGPSDQPPSVSTVEHILDSNFANNGLIPPSLLAEVAKEPVVLEKLSRWNSVAFGGGPLAEDAAKAIWKYTQILPLLGSTETFNIPELVPQSEDELVYHAFHPSLGLDFPEVSEGLCELIFVRKAEAEKHQGAFCTFPDLKEYRMKDLYERHPTKEGLWKYRGRVDDVIVLSNGEKLNPCEAEKIVAAHDEVQSALIVGTGREQPLLVVEPKRRVSVDLPLEIADELQRVNSVLPAFGQIHPTHVCMVEPDTFLRSAKGEVRRKPTVDTLLSHIEQTYETAENSASTHADLDFTTEGSLVSTLSEAISLQILSGKALEAKDNIFSFGIDSLDVLRITRMIKSSMQAQELPGVCSISPKIIYNRRTPAEIAKHLLNIGDHQTDQPERSQEEMQALLDLYLRKIPSSKEMGSSRALPAKQVFLLTGSTGSLGSYLLDSLLRHYPESSIICLNRKGGNATRQIKIQQSRGLSTDLSRVNFVGCDIAQESFGLDHKTYQSLLATTHIIHNAWPVNWNLPLPAFEEQLQACCRLIDLANNSTHDTSVTFLSSIGAGNHWAQEGHEGPVPEAKLDHFDIAEPTGYAQSKLLAEHLFSAASERLGLPVQICRLGQIAGPVNSIDGMWNPQEWFPSILMSSKRMGIMPDDLASMNRIDWIPVDILADILVDIVSGALLNHPENSMVQPHKDSSSSSPLTFMHFVNPNTTNWQDLSPSVARLLGSEMKLVSLKEWIETLSRDTEFDDSNTKDELPAAKLVDFLQGLASGSVSRAEFAVDEASQASEKLHSLQSVSSKWLEQWWQQWSVMLK